MAGLVIDASIAVAWCFPDEETEYTRAVLSAVGTTLDPVAPTLWPYEIHNAVLMGLKRCRINQDDTPKLLTFLVDLDVQLVEPAKPNSIFSLAQKHGLTFYDAAYLEVALRENLPLASLDKALVSAAQAAGVMIFRP